MLTLVGDILMLTAAIASLLLLLPLFVLLTGSTAAGTICRRLATLFTGLNTAVARSVMWFGLLMALLQLAIVILRYMFGINFIWLQEAIIYMFGFLFLLTSGYALLGDEHVRVDIFYRDAAPRRKALVDFLGTYLFLFPVCILIVWVAGPYVARSWAVMETSQEASGIPAVFLLKSLIPLFAILLAMAGFSLATRAVTELRGKSAGAA